MASRPLRVIDPELPESNLDRARRLIKEWRRKPDPQTNHLPYLVNQHTDDEGEPSPTLDVDRILDKSVREVD